MEFNVIDENNTTLDIKVIKEQTFVDMKNIYNEMTEIHNNLLATEYKQNRLIGKEYANVLAQIIATTFEKSIALVELAHRIEGVKIENRVKLATASKEIELKTEQIAELKQRIASMKAEDTLKDLQIKKEIELKTEQIGLTNRQKNGFDDNLRIKKAESLANVVSMFGAGGLVVDDTLLTKMFQATDGITS